MADGLAITPGAGAIAATDEITSENGVGVSARHAQRVKLDVAGTDGAFTDLSAANPLPVSGTFFQATQPVSIAGNVIAVGNVASGVADSGNPVKAGGVYNSAQPALTSGQRADLQLDVNGNLRVAIPGSVNADGDGAANTQLVAGYTQTRNTVFNGTTWDRQRGNTTGTFTQGAAASGAAKAGNPVQVGGVFNTAQPTVTTGQAVEAQATARGGTIVATGADTFNVTVNAALPAGAAVIGKVGIDQTTPGTTNLVSIGTNGTVAINAALPAGANSIGTTPGPALTKGTQGTVGHSVQDLKDAGRVIFSAATVIAGVTAVTVEALLSMVATRDGVAAAGATSFAVTAGKRLRITGISVGMVSTAAAVLSMRFALRMNPAGAAVATSPILRILAVPSGAALAQAGGELELSIPDGIEFSGTHQFAITQIGSAATGTCWVSLTGFEY